MFVGLWPQDRVQALAAGGPQAARKEIPARLECVTPRSCGLNRDNHIYNDYRQAGNDA